MRPSLLQFVRNYVAAMLEKNYHYENCLDQEAFVAEKINEMTNLELLQVWVRPQDRVRLVRYVRRLNAAKEE